MRGSVPKRVKIKPVIRCKVRVVLQAPGVLLRPESNAFGATIAIQNDLVGKMFEVNLVLIPAAVETEK